MISTSIDDMFMPGQGHLQDLILIGDIHIVQTGTRAQEIVGETRHCQGEKSLHHQLIVSLQLNTVQCFRVIIQVAGQAETFPLIANDVPKVLTREQEDFNQFRVPKGNTDFPMATEGAGGGFVVVRNAHLAEQRNEDLQGHGEVRGIDAESQQLVENVLKRVSVVARVEPGVLRQAGVQLHQFSQDERSQGLIVLIEIVENVTPQVIAIAQGHERLIG